MVSIQEWFLIKSGLWCRTMGTWTRNATNNFILHHAILCLYYPSGWQKYITYYSDLHCRKNIVQSFILVRLAPERRVTEGWKQAFTTILATHWKVSESQIKQIVSKVDFWPKIFSTIPIDPCLQNSTTDIMLTHCTKIGMASSREPKRPQISRIVLWDPMFNPRLVTILFEVH